MKISSSLSDMNRCAQKQSFKGIPNNSKFLPNAVGKFGKMVGEYVSMPEQKLFLAVSALMFVPLIDLKYADEDKKVDSAIKSASKAMVGGLTGVTIRAGFLKFVDTFIGFNKYNSLNKYLMPQKARELFAKYTETHNEAAKLMLTKKMDQYNKTLGTLFAILFMAFFSNSKIDVPLTGDVQDLLSGVIKDKKTWVQSFNDVYKARKAKITAWFDKRKQFFLKINNKLVKVSDVLKDDKPKPKKEEGAK